MARSRGTQVPASAPAPVTQVAAPPVAAPPVTDINALRAQQAALKAQIKAAKAVTNGKISAVEVQGDGVMVDITLGTGGQVTKQGEPYLFQCDPVEFVTPDGRRWRTGTFYAIQVIAQA